MKPLNNEFRLRRYPGLIAECDWLLRNWPDCHTTESNYWACCVWKSSESSVVFAQHGNLWCTNRLLSSPLRAWQSDCKQEVTNFDTSFVNNTEHVHPQQGEVTPHPVYLWLLSELLGREFAQLQVPLWAYLHLVIKWVIFSVEGCLSGGLRERKQVSVWKQTSRSWHNKVRTSRYHTSLSFPIRHQYSQDRVRTLPKISQRYGWNNLDITLRLNSTVDMAFFGKHSEKSFPH